VTVISRLRPSYLIRWIWWLAPSTSAAVFGVAPLGFVEHAGDHLRRVFDDARRQPLVFGD